MNVATPPKAANVAAFSGNPLLHFLQQTHQALTGEASGAVASYIPELGKADPGHFGIALATMDGHVYEVGDTAVPFTIQSISKAFVFALAIETAGAISARLGHRGRSVA